VVLIRRLEEQDLTADFDCGDPALNNYLKRHAWNNQRKSSMGVTYAAVEQSAPRVVLGYFTLATASAPAATLPRKHFRGLPSYDVPLILLARLAVDRRFSSHGLGGALLSEALKISSRVSGQVGCRCVVTDAYPERVSWYAKYGFLPLEGSNPQGPQRMFLDIRTIRAVS
jgi:GNAT superfamily N-acetyltransferase